MAWSSLLFALLQSLCTFLAAMSGLRLIIGIGSLAISSEVTTTLGRLHANWVRIPMICLAVAGSLLNVLAIMQIRRLRKRPASKWRQLPIAPRKQFLERLQMALSLVALALIFIEECFHLKMFHTL
jgi:hypothetical protein